MGVALAIRTASSGPDGANFVAAIAAALAVAISVLVLVVGMLSERKGL